MGSNMDGKTVVIEMRGIVKRFGDLSLIHI